MSRSVVITGIGLFCSLGKNKYEVLENMKNTKTGISHVNRFDTSKFDCQIGAEIQEYNPNEYLSNMEIDKYDISAQYGIIALKEAIQESNLELSNGKIGLAYGTCNGGICSIESSKQFKDITAKQYRKYPFFQQADHIAEYFSLNGPVVVMNTACAASGNAIGYAYDLIMDGTADAMLAGGADAMSLSVYAGFNSLQALNNEPCSPYSIKTGLSLGEGAAFVILENLETAIARGATIYGEVRGYGLSNDAYHITAPDPAGRGIEFAVSMAINNCGIAKEEIGYINTHGTGTGANDAAELQGLRRYFGEDLFARIPVSSSKAYFGHNLGAAAAIEYTTTLLCIKEGLLPATINFSKARAGCDDKNIITNDMKSADGVKFFLSNNSAFGGHNCSLLTSLTFGEQQNELERHRVFVKGIGTVKGKMSTKGSGWKCLEKQLKSGVFDLKAFRKDLYMRRMNQLTQTSITSICLALEDADVNTDEVGEYNVGLCYGTSKGSLSSAMKYLHSIYHKGPEYASSIYFPDMVLNSTAGKVSKALNIKGYATSISNGGNEGLACLINAYNVIKTGIHDYCIASAGDELSEFAEHINSAYGVENNDYISGTTSVILASIKASNAIGYAEIIGSAQGFAKVNISDMAIKVVKEALRNANLKESEVDLFTVNAKNTYECEEYVESLKDAFGDKDKYIYLNRYFGYSESASGLDHVSLAAEMIYNNIFSLQLGTLGIKNATDIKRVLTLSVSLNGSCAAVVLSAVE